MTSASDGPGGRSDTPAGGAAELSADPMAGRLVADRYRLEHPLGRGGMGVTWAARDELLDRAVAVKQVLPPAELPDRERELLRERTLREARAAARITSRSAVTVFDVVEEDGRPWIVMERLAPTSLADMIARDGPLPPEQAARIGLDVLEALAAARSVGVLHRDVKPGNVLLHQGRAVLTDFGIATIDGDPALTSTGLIVGSPAYLAPERARGEPPTLAADLWSLGATLYAAVEGTSPFQRPSQLATLSAVVSEAVPPAIHAGPLAPVVQRLLDKEPAERPGLEQTRELLQRIVDAWSRAVAAGPAESHSTETVSQAPDVARTVAFAPVPRRPEPGPLAPWPSAPWPSAAWPPTPARPASGGRTGRRVAGILLALLLVAGYLLVRAVNDPKLPSGGSSSGATPSASQSGADSTGPSSSASAEVGASGAVPAGFRLVTDPSGYRIAVPDGWSRTTSGPRVYYRDPTSRRFLAVDQSTRPRPDPLADWRNQEETVAEQLDGYRRIRIDRVDYRGWDAADWEFTWQPSSGELRVLSRNIRVDDERAYALYWSVPAELWAKSRSSFDVFARTFRPAT